MGSEVIANSIETVVGCGGIEFELPLRLERGDSFSALGRRWSEAG